MIGIGRPLAADMLIYRLKAIGQNCYRLIYV